MTELNCTEKRTELNDGRQIGQRHRIFVDCTETVSSSRSSGIPRVVTNIIKHGRIEARKRGIELIPVRFAGNQFVAAETNAADELVRDKQPPKPVAETRRFIRSLRNLALPKTRAGRLDHQNRTFPSNHPGSISFDSGDILLLPDSSWTTPFWKSVDRAQARGTVLGIIQHDFIPLRHPELVPRKNATIFRQWVFESLKRANFVLAVSKTIAAETKTELVAIGRSQIATRCVKSFRNGADLPRTASNEPIRKSLIEFVNSSVAGPYLTVGVIEPRKNQSLIVSAINKVLANAPDAHFLFAGPVGWSGKPIANTIRNHPGAPSNVRHFEDLNDTELRYTYERAKAVIFPSLAEGYGLPIVESLAQGTQVFASDIHVHREIGEPYCVFFDPTDATPLANALTAHFTDGVYPASWPPVKNELPTWRAAASQIIDDAIHYSVLSPATGN